MTPLLLASLMLVLLCALALARRARRALPRGALVYLDADGRGRPLRSPLRPLSGKPDYVIRTPRGAYVPVELKSYRSGTRPPHEDLVQLGAYLLLLEDVYGSRPPYGVLRYPNRALRVPYTRALRAEVLRLLALAGQDEARPPAATPHPSLCRACPFTPICDAART